MDQNKLAPRVGTKASLVGQAKDLGIKNAPAMRKAKLSEKVADVIKEHGQRRAPRQPKTPIAEPAPVEAAQSLEVPQGIPAPNEGGSSPQEAPVASGDDFDAQIAELQALLQEMGSAQEPAPAPAPVQQAPIPQNRLLAAY
jgi:hypothetical protein